MKIMDNGEIRDMTPEEEAGIEQADPVEAGIEQADPVEEESRKTRPLTDIEVFSLFAAQSINTLSVDDNTSLRMISYYPA